MKKFEALSDEQLQDLGEQDLDQEFPSRVMEEYKKLREHYIAETKLLYGMIEELAVQIRDLDYLASWYGDILVRRGIDHDARGAARYRMHAKQTLEKLKSIGLVFGGGEVHEDAPELPKALVEGTEVLPSE